MDGLQIYVVTTRVGDLLSHKQNLMPIGDAAGYIDLCHRLVTWLRSQKELIPGYHLCPDLIFILGLANLGIDLLFDGIQVGIIFL